jgi:pyridoxine 5-phosphate synthase
MFIDPEPEQITASAEIGAAVVELHVGAYCEARQVDRTREFERLQRAVDKVAKAGLECHAGHGLTFDTVGPVAALPTIVELNIGHFLVGEAIFCGLESSIKRMRALMDKARANADVAQSA